MFRHTSAGPSVDVSQGAAAPSVARGGMGKHVFRSVVWRTAVQLLVDVVRFALAAVRSRSQLAAENLFVRKQLALYRERQVKPRRADDATRITLVMLSHLIDWRAVLTIVKPATLIRWHRTGFRLFWLDVGTRRIAHWNVTSVLQEWVAHDNQGRPYASLGPGIPDVRLDRLRPPNGHRIPDGHRVVADPILAGLHHEYRLEPLAA
jgi:hypothetical protein